MQQIQQQLDQQAQAGANPGRQHQLQQQLQDLLQLQRQQEISLAQVGGNQQLFLQLDQGSEQAQMQQLLQLQQLRDQHQQQQQQAEQQSSAGDSLQSALTTLQQQLNQQAQQEAAALTQQQNSQLLQVMQIQGITPDQLKQVQQQHQHQQQELLQQQQMLLQQRVQQLLLGQQSHPESFPASQPQLQLGVGQQSSGIGGLSASGNTSAPMLMQAIAGQGQERNGATGPADKANESHHKEMEEWLQDALAQMGGVLDAAKEFLKQQRRSPYGMEWGEGAAKRAALAQDERDMSWISGENFSGTGKKTVIRETSEDKRFLQEYGDFKSAFGSRGLPFALLSSEYMPKKMESHAMPLEVTDKDLKFVVLLLMQETLYAGMLQDWEHTLGGGSSHKLVQETLSILSLAKDLSQADIKGILRIKEKGLGESWKRIWETLHDSLFCSWKSLLPFVHTALRMAVERRYALSSGRGEDARRSQHTGAKGQSATQDFGADWSKLRVFLSRILASLESGFAREQSINPELPASIIKSCIIIARFLGDSGQFREADVLFDRARVLAIQGGDKSFCAEVSLFCSELLNKWSASDPAYSIDTMARSAEYASEAAELYESIDMRGDIATQENFSQALYWKGLNYSTLCRLGGTDGCSAETACSVARDALDKCLVLRKEFKAPAAKIAEVQFARGVLTFCMAEALSSGHIYRGIQGDGSNVREQAAHGLYSV